jgi:AhpD family alkylhydroperoxidase
MSTADPRLAPGDRRDLGWAAWVVAALAGRANGTEPPNLFRTLGRHRRLFFGWLHFAGRLMPGGRLPRTDTEAVILRVAHLRDCEYEAHHHRQLGRRAGLSDADLAAIERGADDPRWSPRRRALLQATDELVGTRDLTDESWHALRAHLTEVECIELVLLAAHYDLLATTIGVLRIQPDRPRGTVRSGSRRSGRR